MEALRRTAIASENGHGTETVYMIGKAALTTIVSELGVSIAEARRLAMQERLGPLQHCLAVMDSRVAFTSKAPTGWHVTWFSEIEARHEYLVAGRRHHIFKPDSALLLESETRRQLFFLEVDLGSVSRGQFQSSCRVGYRQYIDLALHRKVYGVDAVEVLCITTGHELRIRHLQAAAKAERVPMRFARLSECLRDPYGSIWTTGENRSSLLSEALACSA